MTKTVHKCFFIWDAEKEEEWLNDMSKKGLELTGVGYFTYTFQEGTPGMYQYRLQMLEHFPNHPESEQYIRLIEETGAQQVATLKNWAYFRKKTADGPFELFSDTDSRLKYFRRLRYFILPLVIMMFAVTLLNFYMGVTENSPFNIGVACPTLLFSFVLGHGGFKIFRKERALKRERGIHE